MLAPNHNDGARAIGDLRALVREEQARVFARKLFLFGAAGSVFCAYNVTRLSQLSPSGRPAAIAGLAFFTFLTYSSASQARFI